MTDEKEKGLMSMYEGSRTREFFGEKSTTNHLPWSILVILLALGFWLVLALSAAENQRYALQTKACQDRVFPTELDMGCLAQVKSRQHWWQHVGHALLHMGS